MYTVSVLEGTWRAHNFQINIFCQFIWCDWYILCHHILVLCKIARTPWRALWIYLYSFHIINAPSLLPFHSNHASAAVLYIYKHEYIVFWCKLNDNISKSIVSVYLWNAYIQTHSSTWKISVPFVIAQY